MNTKSSKKSLKVTSLKQLAVKTERESCFFPLFAEVGTIFEHGTQLKREGT